MNEEVRCPNPACPLPDDVQKLSVVFHGGPPQRFETFTAGVDSETNNWSDQLAAPAPPKRGARWGCVVPGVLVVALFGLCGSVSAIFYTLNPGAIGEVKGNSPPDPPLLALLALGSFALAAWIIINKLMEMARYRRERPAWEHSQAQWDQLYYCNRCGTVFDPTAEGKFVPVSRIRELLA